MSCSSSRRYFVSTSATYFLSRCAPGGWWCFCRRACIGRTDTDRKQWKKLFIKAQKNGADKRHTLKLSITDSTLKASIHQWLSISWSHRKQTLKCKQTRCTERSSTPEAPPTHPSLSLHQSGDHQEPLHLRIKKMKLNKPISWSISKRITGSDKPAESSGSQILF